jgi:type IV pilus assembly protein PilV
MNGIPGYGKQGGVMLLEALIAILIFSVGILAIVGMQATAIQDMGEAKYRTEAAFLANRVIADMWGNMGANSTQAQTNLKLFAYAGSGTPPAAITEWVETVQTRLPGAKDFPPVIVVNADNSVSVTVRWRAAREAGTSASEHSFRSIAYINP